ncbi:hypothetical protein FC770_12765 [Nocardioides jishulii]|uniref:Uncharacterized protein n=1 Tax=Nocardioides jishulii TaxID=2575440 RepID=A0A4V5TLH6_9ACTN|nr:hypothetical protein FCL41_06130 [Nocardioides jishulii]TKI61883.1 hypothetical protein FC770_12765 [Nocardioides jishulii]
MTERLLGAADDLYALAVTDFTLARDALAASLKSEDKELAAAVKALRKPTVAGWAVNLFVRRESEQVDQLLDLGAALRDAQSALDGEELRALSRQRRQVTAAMATRARAVAADEGQRLTQAVLDQVEATFTAALLDEGAAVAVRSGMLVQAITVTGVGPADLTGVVALPDALGFTAPPREAPEREEEPRPVLRLVPDPERRTKERRAAKEEVAAAERAVTRAARAQRSAQRRVDDLEARLLRLRSEADELRRRVAQLEAEAEEVDDELVEAESTRDEFDAELTTAEEERDDAAEALARLERG